MLVSLLLPLSFLLPLVPAVRIPFDVHFTDTPAASLLRRSKVDIGNTGNAQYVANISIAGNSVPVLLDTGSSDLWVSFDQAPTNQAAIKDTGVEVSLAYAVGRAKGTARRGPVEFGGFKSDDQAFLLVEDTKAFTGDISRQGYRGLFGLGPNSGSIVRKKLDKKNADTLMQNILNENKTPNASYITFLLDRQNDPHDPFKGELTISEIIPGFENITSMPKLDVETVTRLLKSDQHWQALTDKDNGITGPDGKPIQVESIVPRAPDGQLVAVIDSGFTFSQVPREVADQIYGRVKGAVYDSKNEWWLVPCGQYLNIAFNFGGRAYPVHPLDVVDDNFNKIDGSGKKVCIGSFQPITSAFSLLGHYDMILGMSFLRSVYTLLDFGSWIENGDDHHPFIQMASHTSVEGGRADFITMRLGGNDTISDARYQLLPFEQMVHSPVSDEEKKKKYQEMVLSRWPYILLGCLAFLVIVTGVCIWKCCCRRKKEGGLKGNKNLGFGFGKERGTGSGAEKMDFEQERRGSGFAAPGGRSSYAALGSRGSLVDGRNGSNLDLAGHRPSGQYDHPRPSGQYDQGQYSPQPQHQQYSHQQQPQTYPPYHDQSYSASNVSLSGPAQPHHQTFNGDYRQSGHSGYDQQGGYAQGQQGYGYGYTR